MAEKLRKGQNLTDQPPLDIAVRRIKRVLGISSTEAKRAAVIVATETIKQVWRRKPETIIEELARNALNGTFTRRDMEELASGIDLNRKGPADRTRMAVGGTGGDRGETRRRINRVIDQFTPLQMIYIYKTRRDVGFDFDGNTQNVNNNNGPETYKAWEKRFQAGRNNGVGRTVIGMGFSPQGVPEGKGRMRRVYQQRDAVFSIDHARPSRENNSKPVRGIRSK